MAAGAASDFQIEAVYEGEYSGETAEETKTAAIRWTGSVRIFFTPFTNPTPVCE
jgi:hypothetical protein